MLPSTLCVAGGDGAKSFRLATNYSATTKTGAIGSKYLATLKLDVDDKAGTFRATARISGVVRGNLFDIGGLAILTICGAVDDHLAAALSCWLLVVKAVACAVAVVFNMSGCTNDSWRIAARSRLPRSWTRASCVKVLMDTLSSTVEQRALQSWVAFCKPSYWKVSHAIQKVLKITDPATQAELERLLEVARTPVDTETPKHNPTQSRSRALVDIDVTGVVRKKFCLCCGELSVSERDRDLVEIVLIGGVPYVEGLPYRAPLNPKTPPSDALDNHICTDCLYECQHYRSAYDAPRELESINARALKQERKIDPNTRISSCAQSRRIPADDLEVEVFARTIANALVHVKGLDQGALHGILPVSSDSLTNCEALLFIVARVVQPVLFDFVRRAGKKGGVSKFDFANFDISRDGVALVPRCLFIFFEELTAGDSWRLLRGLNNRRHRSGLQAKKRGSDSAVVLKLSNQDAEDVLQRRLCRTVAQTIMVGWLGGMLSPNEFSCIRAFYMCLLSGMGIKQKGDFQIFQKLSLSHSYSSLLRYQHCAARDVEAWKLELRLNEAAFRGYILIVYVDNWDKLVNNLARHFIVAIGFLINIDITPEDWRDLRKRSHEFRLFDRKKPTDFTAEEYLEVNASEGLLPDGKSCADVLTEHSRALLAFAADLVVLPPNGRAFAPVDDHLDAAKAHHNEFVDRCFVEAQKGGLVADMSTTQRAVVDLNPTVEPDTCVLIKPFKLYEGSATSKAQVLAAMGSALNDIHRELPIVVVEDEQCFKPASEAALSRDPQMKNIVLRPALMHELSKGGVTSRMRLFRRPFDLDRAGVTAGYPPGSKSLTALMTATSASMIQPCLEFTILDVLARLLYCLEMFFLAVPAFFILAYQRRCRKGTMQNSSVPLEGNAYDFHVLHDVCRASISATEIQIHSAFFKWMESKAVEFPTLRLYLHDFCELGFPLLAAHSGMRLRLPGLLESAARRVRRTFFLTNNPRLRRAGAAATFYMLASPPSLRSINLAFLRGIPSSQRVGDGDKVLGHHASAVDKAGEMHIKKMKAAALHQNVKSIVREVGSGVAIQEKLTELRDELGATRYLEEVGTRDFHGRDGPRRTLHNLWSLIRSARGAPLLEANKGMAVSMVTGGRLKREVVTSLKETLNARATTFHSKFDGFKSDDSLQPISFLEQKEQVSVDEKKRRMQSLKLELKQMKKLFAAQTASAKAHGFDTIAYEDGGRGALTFDGTSPAHKASKSDFISELNDRYDGQLITSLPKTTSMKRVHEELELEKNHLVLVDLPAKMCEFNTPLDTRTWNALFDDLLEPMYLFLKQQSAAVVIMCMDDIEHLGWPRGLIWSKRDKPVDLVSIKTLRELLSTFDLRARVGNLLLSRWNDVGVFRRLIMEKLHLYLQRKARDPPPNTMLALVGQGVDNTVTIRGESAIVGPTRASRSRVTKAALKASLEGARLLQEGEIMVAGIVADLIRKKVVPRTTTSLLIAGDSDAKIVALLAQKALEEEGFAPRLVVQGKASAKEYKFLRARESVKLIENNAGLMLADEHYRVESVATAFFLEFADYGARQAGNTPKRMCNALTHRVFRAESLIKHRLLDCSGAPSLEGVVRFQKMLLLQRNSAWVATGCGRPVTMIHDIDDVTLDDVDRVISHGASQKESGLSTRDLRLSLRALLGQFYRVRYHINLYSAPASKQPLPLRGDSYPRGYKARDATQPIGFNNIQLEFNPSLDNEDLPEELRDDPIILAARKEEAARSSEGKVFVDLVSEDTVVVPEVTEQSPPSPVVVVDDDAANDMSVEGIAANDMSIEGIDAGKTGCVAAEECVAARERRKVRACRSRRGVARKAASARKTDGARPKRVAPLSPVQARRLAGEGTAKRRAKRADVKSTPVQMKTRRSKRKPGEPRPPGQRAWR